MKEKSISGASRCNSNYRRELIKTRPVHELEYSHLFFNNQDKQAIIDRIKNNPESEHIFAALVAEGHRFLHIPIQNPEPEHPKHNRYAGEDPASRYENDILQGVVTLSFLYQMTGDTAYANKAIEFAMDIADWTTWVTLHIDLMSSIHAFGLLMFQTTEWSSPMEKLLHIKHLHLQLRMIGCILL